MRHDASWIVRQPKRLGARQSAGPQWFADEIPQKCWRAGVAAAVRCSPPCAAPSLLGAPSPPGCRTFPPRWQADTPPPTPARSTGPSRCRRKATGGRVPGVVAGPRVQRPAAGSCRRARSSGCMCWLPRPTQPARLLPACCRLPKASASSPSASAACPSARAAGPAPERADVVEQGDDKLSRHTALQHASLR